MVQRLARSAIVIGAGVGGLAASLALAPHVERVVVLERSALPDAAVPRDGVPQGRQPHVLLAAGQRALDAIAPGFEQELVAAGAVCYRVGLDTRYERPGFDPFPQRDLGWHAYALSRPLLELVLRRRAQAEGVELLSSHRVERVLLDNMGRRVSGVWLERAAGGAQRLDAELVIDASGNGKPTLHVLEALGLPAPEETRIEVDIAAASGVFSMPEDAPEWKVLLVLPDAPRTSRGAVLTPLEGGRWITCVTGRHDEKPPGDWDGFMAFARSLRTPTLYEALRRAPRQAGIARFGFPASVWRHFERGPGLPIGLIPIGDAVCRFNPVYGQGMSVAARQALLLRSVLNEHATHADPLAALGPAYFGELAALLETPWALAATPDLAYPGTRGQRPDNFAESLRFGAALARLAAQDADVHRVMMEVQHLLRPLGALRTAELRERVRPLQEATAAAC